MTEEEVKKTGNIRKYADNILPMVKYLLFFTN